MASVKPSIVTGVVLNSGPGSYVMLRAHTAWLWILETHSQLLVGPQLHMLSNYWWRVSAQPAIAGNTETISLAVFVYMCLFELITSLDKWSAFQLAVINPVHLPLAVHGGAACEALQRRGGVRREPRVHRWLWVSGDRAEEQSATQHKMP